MKRARVRIDQSALYRIRSFKRLSIILRCSAEKLEELSASAHNYMEYDQDGRWIEAPKPEIKKVQRRFAELLSQIETPPYLHSGVKKRSYVTNADPHDVRNPTVKIDVKKFYQSSRSAQLYEFLTHRLQWAGDVAGLMVKILTLRGHLPTGGNASPLLSFWIYRDLFDSVNDFATDNGATFSLYIDDMTITGSFVTRKTLHDVRRLVGQSRLKAHKLKYFPSRVGRVITGVAMTRGGRKLPFERQALIAAAESRLNDAESVDERFEVLKPLVGRLCEAAEIDPATWLRRRDRAIAEKHQVERLRTELSSEAAAEVVESPEMPS